MGLYYLQSRYYNPTLGRFLNADALVSTGQGVLPNKYAPFYEYDIYPKVAGQSRGMERIIIGNGAAWYTCDHYMTFIQME